MSLDRIRDAWACALAPAEKLVLLNLAYHANSDRGDRAWPSLATIATECHVNRRTAQRALDQLEAGGYIEVASDATRHRARAYIVHPTRGGVRPPLNAPEVASDRLRGGVRSLEAASHRLRGGVTPPQRLTKGIEPQENSIQIGFDETAMRRAGRFDGMTVDAIQDALAAEEHRAAEGLG
jgi:hypothetical protein